MHYTVNYSYDFTNQVVYPNLASMFAVDGVVFVPVDITNYTCDALDCTYNADVTNVSVPLSVEYGGKAYSVIEVNPYTFYGNIALESASLANNGDIQRNLFVDCSNLKELTITSLGDITDNAFNRFTSLEHVEISNQGDIGSTAFGACSALKTVIISNNGSIGSGAFINCSALETALIYNKGNIRFDAFNGCSALTDVSIGKDVTYICGSAFYGCSALSEIVIPEEISAIQSSAFGNCSNLTTVLYNAKNCTVYQDWLLLLSGKTFAKKIN